MRLLIAGEVMRVTTYVGCDPGAKVTDMALSTGERAVVIRVRDGELALIGTVEELRRLSTAIDGAVFDSWPDVTEALTGCDGEDMP